MVKFTYYDKWRGHSFIMYDGPTEICDNNRGWNYQMVKGYEKFYACCLKNKNSWNNNNQYLCCDCDPLPGQILCND
jgi:hypothetical protein